MKIVTGARGEAHITSNDDQGLHQGMFGNGNYVLNVGQKFEAELTNANTVSIGDGEGVMQGVHFRVLPGTVDEVVIDNGTSGYNRIDLICARYTKNADTGIENVEWTVIKGTPTDSTPTEPEYIEGDILAGDLVADFPMHKVTLTGLAPVVSPMFSAGSSTEEMVEDIEGRVTTTEGRVTAIETKLANPITQEVEALVYPGSTADLTIQSVPAGKYLLIVHGYVTIEGGYPLKFRVYTNTPGIIGCYGGFAQSGPVYSHTSIIQISSTTNIVFTFQNTETNPDANPDHEWMTVNLLRLG